MLQSSGQDEMPSTVAGGVLRADSVGRSIGTATLSSSALSGEVLGGRSAGFYKTKYKNICSPIVRRVGPDPESLNSIKNDMNQA